jgi:hypothetical protein
VTSRQLTVSRKGVVAVSLTPFNQAVAGSITLRQGGKLIARGRYDARSGAAVRVSVKLTAKTLRSLRRHRTLPVILTATAQAGTQVVTKAVRARLRRSR